MDVTVDRAEKLAASLASLLEGHCIDEKLVAQLREDFGYLIFHELVEIPGIQRTMLQAQAVALVRQYGLFLPAPAKDFFRKLAEFLQWDNLKGILK